MQRKSTSPERLLAYTGIAILAFLLLWFQLDLLLLAFAGVLVAVILQAITSWIDRHTRLHGGIGYLVTLLLIAALLVGGGFLLVPRAARQITQLTYSLPASIRQLEAPLQSTSVGRELLRRTRAMIDRTGSDAQVRQIASTAADALTDLAVVIVIGFFAALNPHGYKEGLLVLVPEPRRPRARQIVNELQHQLRWWMLGQTLPMAVLGVSSAIGLLLLHVHLPWTLGLLTGVAVFLPFAGTVLAGIPAVLMGLQRSPQTALWVLCLYTLLHIAEGYILTPLVQRRAVRLPPVLTVLAQYFMWSIAGILGLALAAPLAGAAIVLVKELYLHIPPQQDVIPEENAARQAA